MNKSELSLAMGVLRQDASGPHCCKETTGALAIEVYSTGYQSESQVRSRLKEALDTSLPGSSTPARLSSVLVKR